MIIENGIINDIAKYCLSNKIVFEINRDGEINHVFLDKNAEIKKMTISIINEKDKKLNEMLKSGYEELKQFVNEFATK